MAPAVVEKVAGAGSAAKEFKKESATARLLGSGTSRHPRLDGDELRFIAGSAGIAELAIFHPVRLAPFKVIRPL